MEKIYKCDSCSKNINSSDEGWVEWLVDDNLKKSQFRIVHAHGKSPFSCQYNQRAIFDKTGKTIGDLALSEFEGHDGLMRLLEFISENEKSSNEIIEIIKRIHTPGYEAAREYFAAAISHGEFEPGCKPNFYFQSEINKTIQFINKT